MKMENNKQLKDKLERLKKKKIERDEKVKLEREIKKLEMEEKAQKKSHKVLSLVGKSFIKVGETSFKIMKNVGEQTQKNYEKNSKKTKK